MSEPAIDIASMSAEERLDLIGRLWDSLSDDEVRVSEHEKRILDQRLDRLDREGSSGVPWQEVKRRWEREREGS